MNEHDPLDEALGEFRTMSPPQAVRDANRASVQKALNAITIPVPWWRRSISLPLPVMLAIAAALLISLAAHLLPASSGAGPTRSSIPVNPPVKDDGPRSTLVAAADSQFEYVETQRYLSGIGVVDRNVSYRIQE
jgi:hypothetical protein